MEFIFELILIEFIRNLLGVRVRYIFYKLIGKHKTIEYLSGKFKELDNDEKGHQLTLNLIVGFIAFFGLFFCVFYILHLFGLTYLWM
ncbi:hypothetical protein CLV62_13635 [Dysgonomonas alginatilytica]|uniref:Uncharacterized protein n=1 Tax=Dysgonomonas alginatilytica TaxID=1605892 RepID=A0A2V3PKH3_9BACT|nr:hypothetical protein [Dysgonomonas alginatilytica]PXV59414.1 hypothetical protein CLV62_13635 [Dysgonomonas alginatilytica]